MSADQQKPWPAQPDPRVGLNPTGRIRRSLAPSRRKQARRWENPLPVPEWVAEVRQALELAPTNDRAEETS